MEFEKTGIINYKVFKERDIKELVSFFTKVEDELNHVDTELRLVINFKDGSSVRGVDISILDETKLVESINFTLRNFRLNKKIEIYVSNLRGNYKVESEDVDWVDAKFSQIEEVLNAVPDQNFWLSNFRRQLIISNILGITLGFLIYISFFVKIIDEEVLESDIFSLLSIILSIAVGQLIVGYLMNNFIFKL